MKITIFGLSITSSWGNGHATTFRALCSALHARGHRIVFFEKNVEWYQNNRDLPEPPFWSMRFYDDWQTALPIVRRELHDSDVAMVGSYFPDGISALGEMLESGAQVKTFYDIDTPITIRALRQDGGTDYLLPTHLPELDIYFSFTGGQLLREIENDFGASLAVPLYCSVDPKRHHPLAPSTDFACDMSYMGTYAPDRQPKVDDLLFGPAAALPDRRFIVAGPQYPDSLQWPGNVQRITHLNPVHHALFYSSSRMTLNVTRREMVVAGFSPSVRLFEAAACGAAIISDNWPGLDTFFTPGKEILLPADGRDVARYILNYSERELKAIGQAARERVLAAHTNEARAVELERAVQLVASRAHIKTKNLGTKVLETNL